MSKFVRNFNFFSSKNSLSGVLLPTKFSVIPLTPSATPTPTNLPVPTPIQTTGDTSMAVFFKTDENFISAINNPSNLVFDYFHPLKLVWYKKGVTLAQNSTVDKIISFTSNTGSYRSGFESFNKNLNKIYINDNQENWLSQDTYQKLIDNKLNISLYSKDEDYLGKVRVISGEVASDQGTLVYDGEGDLLDSMEYFTFEFQLTELIGPPTGYLILKLSGQNFYETAVEYLINNKLSFKEYISAFNTFLINVPTSVLEKKDIYSLREEIQNEDFCKYCVIDSISYAKSTSQIPYESSYHWYLQRIKSREAWELMDSIPTSSTHGVPVEVAMIDTQVDIGHPELAGKISEHSYNMLSFYDSNISPSDVGLDFNTVSVCLEQEPDNAYILFHGTGTAGLISASNSNNDLMYSASNDKVKVQLITSSRHTLINGNCIIPFPSSWQAWAGWASAFNRILQNPNCVVVSTSQQWGGTDSEYYGPGGAFLQEVINELTTQGRNGKGIPFFASAGNQSGNSPGVIYPGNYDNVYSVGASNQLDNKAGFSQYGSNLFIVAPGEHIMSLSPRGRFGKNLGLPLFNISEESQKIPPNDINYKDLRYTNDSLQVSDGTSSSAPIVATVAATMIYVNPSLTKQQVISILAETARKATGTEGYIYTNGKNLEMGYGIVDHEAAINEAILLIPSPEPWDEPIRVAIINLPETALFGEVIEISYEVTIREDIVGSMGYVSVDVYFGAEAANPNEYLLVSQFVYTEFDEVTSFTENIQVPIQPFGETVNKYVKVRARVSDELFIAYGTTYDYSIIQIANSLLNSPVANLTITLMGLVCLNNGISCNQLYGYAWKVKVRNVGNVYINVIGLNLQRNFPPYDDIEGSGWAAGEYTFVGSVNHYFYTTINPPVVSGNIDNLLPGEERILYWKGPQINNYELLGNNFPARFRINISYCFGYLPYDPETGMELGLTTFNFLAPYDDNIGIISNNFITLYNWPSPITNLPG